MRGARYLLAATDEGRVEVRRTEQEESIGSLLLRADGRAWGLLDGDYELTRDIVAKVREGQG